MTSSCGGRGREPSSICQGLDPVLLLLRAGLVPQLVLRAFGNYKEQFSCDDSTASTHSSLQLEAEGRAGKRNFCPQTKANRIS